MPKFDVAVREVHVSYRRIDAEDAEDAVNRVRDGEGEEVAMEYSHTLTSDTWTVEEVGECCSCGLANCGTPGHDPVFP